MLTVEAMGAVQAAMDTAELVENILSHLPFIDLINLQRVCMLWRDTITRSKTIRQELFLSPDEGHHPWAVVGTTFNDLRFVKVNPDKPLPSPVWISRAHKHPLVPTSKEFTPVRLHPFLKYPRMDHAMCISEEEADQTTVLAREVLTSTPFLWRLIHTLQDPLGSASWRNMYLCNPPCTKMDAKITFEVSARKESTTVHIKLDEPSGITFGLLIDRALDAEIASKNGKKCSEGHGSARSYVHELERESGLTACVREWPRALLDRNLLTIYDVVVPSEEEWEEVARDAKQIE